MYFSKEIIEEQKKTKISLNKINNIDIIQF